MVCLSPVRPSRVRIRCCEDTLGRYHTRRWNPISPDLHQFPELLFRASMPLPPPRPRRIILVIGNNYRELLLRDINYFHWYGCLICMIVQCFTPAMATMACTSKLYGVNARLLIYLPVCFKKTKEGNQLVPYIFMLEGRCMV